jgi:hypothetical protein
MATGGSVGFGELVGCIPSGIGGNIPVVLHGLAANVGEAKLMLAVLEVRGESTQVLVIQNNRPL